MDTAETTVIALLTAGLIAAFKVAAPILQKQVPNFLWPIVAMVLAHIGTSTCKAIGATCGGNPLNWTEPQAQAAATALLAIIIREISKYSRPQLERVIDWLRTLQR